MRGRHLLFRLAREQDERRQQEGAKGMALNAMPGKATRSYGTGIFPFSLGDHYWPPGIAWRVPHPDPPSQSCPGNMVLSLRSTWYTHSSDGASQSCLSLVKLGEQGAEGERSKPEGGKESSPFLAVGGSWGRLDPDDQQQCLPRAQHTQAPPSSVGRER